jgi:putative intracellular protease/amidase
VAVCHGPALLREMPLRAMRKRLLGLAARNGRSNQYRKSVVLTNGATTLC